MNNPLISFFLFFFFLRFPSCKTWLFQNGLHQVQPEPSCSHMTPASYKPSCFLLIYNMFSIRQSLKQCKSWAAGTVWVLYVYFFTIFTQYFLLFAIFWSGLGIKILSSHSGSCWSGGVWQEANLTFLGPVHAWQSCVSLIVWLFFLFVFFVPDLFCFFCSFLFSL